MHSWDPVQCCEMRKVAPLKQALDPVRGVGHGAAPRGRADAARDLHRSRLGRQERPGQGEPARGLDPAGPRGVRLGQRRAAQPASVAGLPVDRLRAVHPAGRQRRGRPRRAAGSASTRPSAGSTSDERLPAAARPRRPPGRRRRRRTRWPPAASAGWSTPAPASPSSRRGCARSVSELVAAGAVGWLPRDYAGGADLDGAWLVHTATGDPATDAAVRADAEALRVLCVDAGQGAAGTAQVPAVARVEHPRRPGHRRRQRPRRPAPRPGGARRRARPA